MSSDVVLSSALRNNLLSLQSTQRNIDTAQLRLSTGLKVNSALDNPQSFFTAQSLNNRASDLTRLLDGISQSIRTIEQANTGAESLGQLLDQAESIALEAQAEIRSSEGFSRVRGDVDLTSTSDLTTVEGGGVINAGDQFNIQVTQQDGTSTDLTITIAAGENVDDIVSAINTEQAGSGSGTNIGEVVTARVTSAGQLEIASVNENASIRISNVEPTGSAQVVGQALSTAGFSALGLDTIAGAEDDGLGTFSAGGTAIAGNTLYSGTSAADQVNGKFEASATLDATAGTGAGYLAAGGDINLQVTIDGETTDLGQVLATDTVQDVIDRVNNSGLSEVEASFNTETGQIELSFDDTVGQVELQFNDNAASTTSFGFGGGASDAALAGNSKSEQFTFDGVNPDVDQYEEDYNNVREQIDQLVEDSNYRGVNLLSGDNLTSFFNEDRDNTLETEGVDFTAIGLGIEEGNFTNAASVSDSISSIREAVGDVRNFGQSIANDLSIVQFRQDFTEQTINTLQSGADDLVVADQNEEGANLLALQTRQALGTTALSLAAQSQQSVLRLF